MLKDHEVASKLREMSAEIPEDNMVLLPDITPRKMWDATIDDVPFENVALSKLLYFIADMI